MDNCVLVNQQVSVAGGVGYVGSALTGRLLLWGAWVAIIDKLLFCSDSLLGFYSHSHFSFAYGDVCEPSALPKAVEVAARKVATDLSGVVNPAAIVEFTACQAADRYLNAPHAVL